MTDATFTRSIDSWIAELRTHFLAHAPDLIAIFETYSAEAAFGRRYLAPELTKLPVGAKILEIGAGSFMLTCQLKAEGFAITGLEPVSHGFSHFERMRALVLEKAAELDRVPDILESTGEELNVNGVYDFSFSLNVMEHVHDVGKVIENVGRALKPGGVYRFTCPNYLFPYEPHFNMPTLISRSLTETVMKKRIFENTSLLDPAGIWRSLNWINVVQVRAIVRKIASLSVSFNTKMLVETFERVGTDPEFAARRSPGTQKLLNFLVALHLHKLLRLAPPVIQPIMDCRIVRIS